MGGAPRPAVLDPTAFAADRRVRALAAEFSAVREFDGQRSMPELPRFAVEPDRRFGEIGDMLDGQSARAPAIDHFRCRRCGLQSA